MIVSPNNLSGHLYSVSYRANLLAVEMHLLKPQEVCEVGGGVRHRK